MGEGFLDYQPVSAPDYTPVEKLRAHQLRKLQAMVARAYDRVELFRSRLDERGITPGDIRTLDDVAKLPFTVKADLRDTYPFGLFASEMKEVVRLHASSGTTGKPIVVAYTAEDIDVWKDVMMRTFACGGCHAGDVIQNAYGYACSPAGSAPITGPRPLARPSSRSPAGTPTARS